MINNKKQNLERLLNNELLRLFENDDFKGFIYLLKSYDKYSYIPNFKIDEGVIASESVKYIEPMLYTQKFNYEITYIDHLVQGGYSDNVISFFNYLKENSPTEKYQEQKSIKSLLKTIVNKKDINILSYLINSPVRDLADFSKTNYLVSVFIENEFKEGLDFLRVNRFFDLFVFQDVVESCRYKKNVNWSLFEEVLNLSDLDLFKDIIFKYVQAEELKSNDRWKYLKNNVSLNKLSVISVNKNFSKPIVMTNTCEGILPIYSGFNSGIKSSYYSYKGLTYIEPSSELNVLWLNYNLQVNLPKKIGNNKINKI